MANPRQRRKARSSSTKVRLAKHANSRLKKVTPRNFPEALADAYNPRETPVQNYRRLGLLSGKLTPRLAGGIEKDTSLTNSWLSRARKADEFEVLKSIECGEESDGSSSADATEAQIQTPAHSEDKQTLSKGEGKIIRDEKGKIIKILIGDEPEIEVDPASKDTAKIVIKRSQQTPRSTPWGEPFKSEKYETESTNVDDVSRLSKNTVPQGIGYENPRMGVVPPKTKFVEELIEISQQRSVAYDQQIKNQQHLSSNQENWLMNLIKKHGIDNVNAMAHDLKLNKHQKTAGEIRRMISKLKES
ncbi:hypothetical protein O181_033937 [Austropuccinia psidii MF-1]|uniref:Nucleolar protein 16 n=1 Tax=Austropuccinia psidii MF-1 TaxID=1389203 RepID=A0A9Q3D5M2_9BASI|nr:hypothetical protein [Austropuccinia psidii MF-1]